MQTDDRISLLDARLANQIAAGEVVERPASVVKELVENSIDAGATRIEVDIERGGTRLIRITDNGKGIHKDDLPLALTRHATSKIHTTDDLANIQSLGFRGEALASISSVSRLTLTSRTAESKLAWQAMAQGRDMTVDIQPAAASPGSRVEIADLFFNTPARQKFLRTEKTEFSHIEEVFKRHALANFAIAFVLKHNHKIIKRVPACGESSQRLKRIATICGKSFAESSIPFECNHEAMRLWGWLGRPEFHRSESDIQYVFINGRPVKDKTLNHAVRQAYEGLLPPGRMATYVIYLEVDPRRVDVNVHPTKHEVRFSEQRLVHDLLAKSIADALAELTDTRRLLSEELLPEDLLPDTQLNEQDYPKSTLESGNADAATHMIYESMPVHSANFPTPNRMSPTRPAYTGNAQVSRQAQSQYAAESTASKAHSQLAGVVETTRINSSSSQTLSLGENYFITQLETHVGVLKADQLLCEFIQQLIAQKLVAKRKALLFPQYLTLPVNLLEDYKSHDLLEKLGFELQPDSGEQIIIRQIPMWATSLGKDQIAALITDWLVAWSEHNLSAEKLAELICTAFTEIPAALVELIIAQMPLDPDCHGAVKQLTPDQVAGLFQ